MKDPKEENSGILIIHVSLNIGPSSVSHFDVHDFDIKLYSIFVCVLL